MKAFILSLVASVCVFLSGYVGAWYFCDQTAFVVAPEQPVMSLQQVSEARSGRIVLLQDVQEDYDLQSPMLGEDLQPATGNVPLVYGALNN